MVELHELITGETLLQDCEALADPKLDFESDRERVNRLVLNVVAKYVAAYLEVSTASTPKAWLSEIKMLVDFTVQVALSEFAETGDVDPKNQGGDNYAVRCLADLRQTAAIFKEIVFNDRFQKERSFFGLDLGSGTGILSLAQVLSARRAGVRKVSVVGVDRSPIAVERAGKVVKALGLEKEIRFDCADLLAPGFIGRLVDRHFVHSWVSETISIAVPALDLSKPDLGLSVAVGRKPEFRSDPFAEVLLGTIQAIPDFVKNVRAGDTAMFPNPLSGLYEPDGNRSTLKLLTGTGRRLPLERLGQEFEAYGDLNVKHRRWAREGDYRD